MSIQISKPDFIKMVDHYLKKELQASLDDFPNIWAEDYYQEGLTVKEAKEVCIKIKEDCLNYLNDNLQG